MVDELVRKARLIVRNRGNFVLAGNIRGGDDRELAPGNSVPIADAADAPSRNAAAHGYAIDHSGESEIVHILGAAGDLVPPFFSDHGMPKKFFFHSCRPRAYERAFYALNTGRDRLSVPTRGMVPAPRLASSARTVFAARCACVLIRRR